MPILTRRIGETLFFELSTGDRMAVAVLDNSRSQVRVGIEAPAEVKVVREGVWLREACAEQGCQRTRKRRLSAKGWRRP